MTFDDLRKPWQKTNGEALSPREREDLIAHVCRRAERLGASIVRRDWMETLACVVGVFLFGGAFFDLDHPVAKTGAGIILVSLVYIIYKIHRTRTADEHSPWSDSLRDFCGKEIVRIDRQIQLVRSVLWWYIAPILVGCNLVFFGANGLSAFAVGYCLFTLVFAWGIYALNQRAVVRHLMPVRNELMQLQSELGE